MKDKKQENKNLRKIKNALLGGQLTRFVNSLIERRMESIAMNPLISYSAKKSLARRISEKERRIRNNLSGIEGALYNLARPAFVPVHLHHKKWNGVDYKIWERKSLSDDDSTYTIFFPNLRFPSFSEDISLTPKEGDGDSYNFNRSNLDGIIEYSIWKNILYQSPIFHNTPRHERPDLSDKRSFTREIPFKGIPETVRVPLFKTDSFVSANADARAIVEIFQEYQEPIRGLVKLLKTSPEVRREFINKSGELETEQLLKKHGLNIDILPSVTNKEEDNHESIPYTVYELKGGSSGGANSLWYWGFIHGIQFPDFEEQDLIKYEKDILRESVELMFDYALYSEPFFKPDKGFINHPTPQLINDSGWNEEARIAGIEIPKGIMIPFTRSPDIDYVRKNIETAVHAYNIHKNQMDTMTARLPSPEIRSELTHVLRGLDVHNLSDSVAEFLGEQGARFMVENPYHLERKQELEADLKDIYHS